jgi:hypothetical protein
MTPEERTSRTAELFEQARVQPVEGRASFLRTACAGDDELYERVLRLLDRPDVPTSEIFANTNIAEVAPLPDSVTERYDSIEFIGRGGMGVVYRARDRELGTSVALKVVGPGLAGNERMAEKLLEEIQRGREVAHKNVCRTYGWQRFGRTILMEMEYVEGETLRSLLDRVHGVSVPQGLIWAREICEALAAIHEKDIVHRDLKPGNIMLGSDGHLKVLDFGIARMVRSAESTSSTSVGTPDYMPPEQIHGRTLGPYTDIYALGAVLHELFTGRRHTWRNPGHEMPDQYLPREIRRTIAKCLEENCKDRFQSAQEVIAALSAGRESEGGKNWPLWTRTAVLLSVLVLLISTFLLVKSGSAPGRLPKPLPVPGRVDTLAFAPSGRMLACGGDDRIVRLLEFPSLRLLTAKLVGHERAVQALAFNADGHWLASASQDRTVKAWEVGTGQAPRSFVETGSVSAVALSADGRWLASSALRTAKIWDLRADRNMPLRVLKHDDYVSALAFSADGRLLASGSDDETVKVWNVETGRPATLEPLRHTDGVTHAVFSPDGRWLASGSFDRKVKIWSTSSWREIQTFEVEDEVMSLSFNSAGTLLMAVAGIGHVSLWKAPEWQSVPTPPKGDPDATAWAFSPDGKTLAIGTREGCCRVEPLGR